MKLIKYVTPALITILSAAVYAGTPPKGKFNYRHLAGTYIAIHCQDTLDSKNPVNNVAYLNTPLNIAMTANGLSLSSSDQSANDLFGTTFNSINLGPQTSAVSKPGESVISINTTNEYTTQTGIYKEVNSQISVEIPGAPHEYQGFKNIWNINADPNQKNDSVLSEIVVRVDNIYLSGQATAHPDPDYNSDKFLQCQFRRLK